MNTPAAMGGAALRRLSLPAVAGGVREVLAARPGALFLAAIVGWVVPFPATFLAIGLARGEMDMLGLVMVLVVVFLLQVATQVWVSRIAARAQGAAPAAGPLGALSAFWGGCLAQGLMLAAALAVAFVGLLVGAMIYFGFHGGTSELRGPLWPVLAGIFAGVGGGFTAVFWGPVTALATAEGAGPLSAMGRGAALGAGRRAPLAALALGHLALCAAVLTPVLSGVATAEGDTQTLLALLISPVSAIVITLGSVMWSVAYRLLAGGGGSANASIVAEVFT